MNNYSISTQGLASGLQRSASALKTAGNDQDEVIALMTAGNAVQQDPESVGAGLRTISQRILGTEESKKELSDLGEDVEDFVVQTSSKLDQTVRDYTAVASNAFKGISLLDDNGNYRSTYEILRDISKVYKEILETDKQLGTNRGQALLELLAGKNRSNIQASILNNPDLLENAYNSSKNESANSAQKELDAYLDSISGKLQKLQNAWQELWYNLIDSEAIKFFIDLGSNILKAVDNIGVFKVALASIASILSLKKVGKTRNYYIILNKLFSFKICLNM